MISCLNLGCQECIPSGSLGLVLRSSRGQGRSPGEQRRFLVAVGCGALGGGSVVVPEFKEGKLLRTRMGIPLLPAKLQQVAPQIALAVYNGI